MPIQLLIALIAVGVLIVAFLIASVAKTASATKVSNNAANTEPAQEVAAEKATEETVAEDKKVEKAAIKPAQEEKVAAKEESQANNEPAVVIGDVDGKTKLKINRIPFSEKIAMQPENVQGYFNDIYNEFLSYKQVHARVSRKYVSFRFGRQLIAKLLIKGKTMKLALALDVNAFDEKTYFHKDMSKVKAYAEVPFTVKVKSGRAGKRAVQLADIVAEKYGAVKKNKYVPVDAVAWVKAKEKK